MLLPALAMLTPLAQLTLEPAAAASRGKHVVLLAGDEEYRSEEALPQLAKILSARHGFRCTVLFSLNGNGEIDPNVRDHQPGLEALRTADVCIMMLRFRAWPEEQMRHFVDYYLAGKPIIALRTSTHAFEYPAESTNAYRRFGWRSGEWPGGFGKQVLGETWVNHWGDHGRQATRGILAAPGHPVLRGVSQIFGDTDVYEAAPPPDATVLVLGQVLAGMAPDSPPADGRKKTSAGHLQDLNDPMMPVVWTRDHPNEAGKINRILTCT
ncbi:MAG TPA: hypothetical protein VM328_05885, partial [Fimbriimonadaceae bacterium]|nr:hypothetical protein [Fimbriimonadaceae bacterium]